MSSPALDRIITTAELRLVGAVKSAIQYELFSVVDEFLRESGVWKDEIPFTTNTTSLEYRIVPTAGQILRLQDVRNAADRAVWATMPTPGCIELRVLPVDVEKYTAKVVLSVADPVTRDAYPLLPKWIVTKYNGVLVDGVLGHMMSQSSKPYSNETLGVYHLRRFRNGIATARADALHDHTEGDQNWLYPQSFAVKRKWK